VVIETDVRRNKGRIRPQESGFLIVVLDIRMRWAYTGIAMDAPVHLVFEAVWDLVVVALDIQQLLRGGADIERRGEDDAVSGQQRSAFDIKRCELVANIPEESKRRALRHMIKVDIDALDHVRKSRKTTHQLRESENVVILGRIDSEKM